jgi:hypothetical protein
MTFRLRLALLVAHGLALAPATAEAKADFATASNARLNQPKARKLAQTALAEWQ